MTIYERANLTIADVLKAMIIRPKTIQILNDTTNKVYNVEKDINLNHYKEYFTRNNALVVNLDYNEATQILKIFIK